MKNKMKDIKLVFISGPYTLGDVARNVKRAMETANKLINLGYYPFCPHLYHFMHMNKYQPYDKWMEIDLAFLLKCDCLLRIPGESKGADKEVEFAKESNIPVYYSLSELLS